MTTKMAAIVVLALSLLSFAGKIAGITDEKVIVIEKVIE